MISNWNFESHFIGTVGWNLVITITISLFRFVLMLQRIQCRSEKTWVLKPHWMLLLILIKMLWQFEIGIWGPNVLLNLICLDSSHQLLKIAMENLRPTMLLQTFDSSWNKLVAEIRQWHLLHRQGAWRQHSEEATRPLPSTLSSAFTPLPSSPSPSSSSSSTSCPSSLTRSPPSLSTESTWLVGVASLTGVELLGAEKWRQWKGGL